ncbi:MAG: hypothetical protein JWP87_96 [Labilithrix sp.]|jgi:uncharacterized protein (TIGR02271 family)|nr:hypothetical protein [Labilithrix sp.]
MAREVHAVVPVVREEISVTKRSRPVERVRVRKRVVEGEVPLELVSAREDVEVVREPIGRVVTSVPQIRVEGDTTIVPVVEETVVVEKRLLLREEIRITKRRTEETRRVSIPVKGEQVSIEREVAEEELRRR